VVVAQSKDSSDCSAQLAVFDLFYVLETFRALEAHPGGS